MKNSIFVKITYNKISYESKCHLNHPEGKGAQEKAP